MQFHYTPTIRSDELPDPEPINRPATKSSSTTGRASRLANRHYSQVGLANYLLYSSIAR